MNLHITDLSKSYQALEEKATAIYKLSGYTLDDILERFAKGWELVPNETETINLADLVQE